MNYYLPVVLAAIGIGIIIGAAWVRNKPPSRAAEPPVFGKHYCVLHWPGHTGEYTVDAYDSDLQWMFFARDHAETFMHFMDKRKEKQS